MSEAKKQHYVPRFYLKNFLSNEKENKIYCYDKINNCSFPTNTNDIAQENKFYEIAGFNNNEIENAISKLEREYWSPAYFELIKEKNFKNLSNIRKNQIYLFLAFQLIRTKAEQEEIVNYYNAIIAKIKEVYGESDKSLKLISDMKKRSIYT